ncbi:hypothetical protein WAB17_01150 [Parerythrobacter aurantius]|uniref:hypothetical protein n=1 Tax=Parerythrobacter aurantius TaxID=3127706 RepID=UPI003250A997
MTDRAEGSKFGIDIAIAQADEDYRRTTYVLECPELDQPMGFHETMDSYLDSRMAEAGKMLDLLKI